jgi:hypothetical protein
VFVLKGGMGKKQRQALAEALAAVSEVEQRVILATGSYIGEGFDDARLDTLFFALPISWRGTLQQYVGRACIVCTTTSASFRSTATWMPMSRCSRECTSGGSRDTVRLGTPSSSTRLTSLRWGLRRMAEHGNDLRGLGRHQR